MVSGMEPPMIRVSRFEQSIAIKWHDDENWYRVDPDAMIYGALGKSCKVGPGDRFGPDAEWIDPFQDPRPDIRRWTEPMRRQLRETLDMLDQAERHPWSG